jgi:hypothetical protein
MQDQFQKGTQRDLDEFRPSRRVIIVHPVWLYYAMEKLVAPDVLQVASYIIREPPYKYGKFLILLQS